MKTIRLAVILSVSALSQLAHAGLDIEPLIGYEQVQKFRPQESKVERLFYGLRVTMGMPLLSLELEGTRAQDSQNYPALSTTTDDTTDSVKIGLRSQLSLASALKLIARAGIKADRTDFTETVSGVSTTTKETWDGITPKPYAGAGLRVRLTQGVSLTGDVVTVFKDWPDMDKNEYQTSLGLNISIGSTRGR